MVIQVLNSIFIQKFKMKVRCNYYKECQYTKCKHKDIHEHIEDDPGDNCFEWCRVNELIVNCSIASIRKEKLEKINNEYKE